MRCPLSGGPLHAGDMPTFEWDRGHVMTADEMRTAVEARVGTALWMAIGAVETEHVPEHARGGGDGV